MDPTDPSDAQRAPQEEERERDGRTLRGCLGFLARPGFWAILIGICTATMGAVMQQDFESPVWMVLLFVGLVVFGFGLVLKVRDY